VRRWQKSVTRDAEGVLSSTDLLVSEKSGTPDMSVDVAGGACMVLGTEATYQGTYFMENRSTTNLVISAADATNARWDLVVAKVEDSDYSGATDAWSLAVVTGTPAASPADPAVPDNSITLARVTVAALDSSIEDADVTDLRPLARLHGEVGSTAGASTDVPTSNATLMSVTFDDPGRPVYVDGTVGAGLYHSADLSVRKIGNYYLRISTDGGSSYDIVHQFSVDVQQGSGGVYRSMFALSGEVGPVLPTGAIIVDMQHGGGAHSVGDIETRYANLKASWRPA